MHAAQQSVAFDLIRYALQTRLNLIARWSSTACISMIPVEPRPAGALPGRAFSALELLCIMYAGFQEDRAENGYRRGHGRGVEDGGELREEMERL